MDYRTDNTNNCSGYSSRINFYDDAIKIYNNSVKRAREMSESLLGDYNGVRMPLSKKDYFS